MAILLTGGAGYIGSHCYYELLQLNKELLVFDNLSTGFRDSLPESAIFIEGDVGDEEALDGVFKKYEIEAVIHFAGSLIVEESVSHPEKYYLNNVRNTLSLLNVCKSNDVNNIIFSSTASVYGSNPKQIMDETDPYSPENPYATSKMMVEYLLKDYSRAYGLNYVILRYFNVAGADPELRTGQKNKDATHLIKIGLEVATGKRDSISIFGTDYPTDDGTCIRDYIHITDLAAAHLKSLDYLLGNNNVKEAFNCGYGQGYSVRQVLATIEKVIGKKLNINEADRRPGDPVALIADSSKIKKMLNWKPKYNNIETIIKTAMDWERKL